MADVEDTIYGSNAADTLVYTTPLTAVPGVTWGYLIYGYDGDDTITTGEGIDSLYGGDGDDSLSGGGNSDRILGGYGDDELYGGDGDDYLQGGRDDDTIYGGDGDDAIYGSTGQDVIYTDDGDDVVYAGSDNDTVNTGDAGNDVIYVEDGWDKVFATGSGAHYISGGSGNDSIFVDDSMGASVVTNTDTVYGGEGEDRIYLEGDDDVANGGRDDDYLEIDNGSNAVLNGDSGDDDLVASYDSEEATLNGGLGDDYLKAFGNLGQLNGNDGNDTLSASTDPASDTNVNWLNGGNGDDVFFLNRGNTVARGASDDDVFNVTGQQTLNNTTLLVGGGGNDVFAFGDGAQYAVPTIADFNQVDDLIDISGVGDYDYWNDTFTYAGFDSIVLGVASGTTLGYVHSGGNTIITGEMGADDLVITLNGIFTLSDSDFIYG